MAAVLHQIHGAPGKSYGLVLTMTEEGFDISGKCLTWSEIDRVGYRAVDRHLNGAYMGTEFTVEVGNAAKNQLTFKMQSGTTGPLKSRVDTEGRERNRVEWLKAVEILEARVGVRLVGEAVMAVRQGGEVNLAGLRLDPYGIHKGGLFSKSVAWQDVAGTEVKSGFFRIVAHKGGKTKKAIEISNQQWNTVLLPRVIDVLCPRAS